MVPRGGDNKQQVHSPSKRPLFVSFVSKAVLWERPVSRRTSRVSPQRPSALCPRFLSHMKSDCQGLRPPCFLSSKPRPQPPSAGFPPAARPCRPPSAVVTRGHASDAGLVAIVKLGSAAAAARLAERVSFSLPLSAGPAGRTSVVAPRPLGTGTSAAAEQESFVCLSRCFLVEGFIHMRAGGRPREEFPNAVPVLSDVPPIPPSSAVPKGHAGHSDPARPRSNAGDVHGGLAPKGGKRASPQVAVPDPGEPDREFRRNPSGSERPEAASSSDFSRRSSGLFSRGSVQPDPSLGSFSPASPDLPRGSGRRSRRSSLGKTPVGFVPHDSGAPRSPIVRRRRSVDPADAFDRPAGASGDVLPPLDSLCSSSPMSPRSGARRAPSADARRWPVLPPISSFNERRRGSTAASPDSNPALSRPNSSLFDELDAVAPPSPSSRSSPDREGDSTDGGAASSCHEARLRTGLAALALDGHSGHLSSLSRVRLLLLQQQRTPPEDPGRFPAADGWSPRRDVTSTSAGPKGTPDSAWRVPEDGESDWSVGGSGSLSSRLTQQSPSPDSSPEQGSGSGSGSGVVLAGVRDQTEAFPGRVADEEERKSKVLKILYKLQDPGRRTPGKAHVCSDFDDFDFLAKYCIFSPEKLREYQKAFEAEDSDADGYISCVQVVDALKRIIPAEILSEEEEIYVYRILALVDFRVTDGPVDVRLFAVIASLAQKIAGMDDFMRSLVTNMDFRSLEARLFKVKRLFLFLLEEQRADSGARPGFIGAEQLLLELKAGGVRPDREAAVARELRNLLPLDLVDFLAYLPLFMLIHTSVVANPLDDASQL
ncbi:nascent polypeptide-associated complex subunit alpha, muscle-specific form isoform X2 [Syngnathoides biaculeatus]|uniref:nascent polypeptide-associated complex subunit alpha, muscle-specific form isoform X2 n=1 Tax=Syngnathoides biaculeatus TaxID=300417 RepID=UPI002ADE41F8|nr:nascent polypeptide-associated complex subunit alpha, muscle-specific form isoform X2 [Syngnathoides biaculeatus]